MPERRARRPLLLLLWAAVAASSSLAGAQTTTHAALQPRQEHSGRVESGETHIYPFRLESGQLARITMTRLSGELHYRITGPNGQNVVHNQQTFFAGSYDSFVAASSSGGEYQLTIYPKSLPGSYRIKIAELRPWTAPADELRLRAQSIREAVDTPDHHAADAPLREALVLLRQAGDEQAALITMLEIIQNSRWLSRQQHDRALCEEAVALAAKLGDRYAEAEARSHLGVIYSDLNQKARALDELEKALALSTALNDAAGRIRSLNLSGSLFTLLGQDDRSLAYYRRSIALARDAGIEIYLAGALFGAATTLVSLNRGAEAVPLLEEARRLYAKQPERTTNEAMVLLELASIAEAARQKETAFRLTREALDLVRAMRNDMATGHALSELARRHALQGEWKQAAGLFEESTAFARITPVGLYLSTALTGLARARWELSDPAGALAPIRESLEIVESAVARAGGTEAQTTYFTNFRNQYSLLAAILSELGNDAEAFEISERSRARSLAAVLSSAKVDLRAGISPELLAQSADLDKQIAARLNERAGLERRKHKQSEADALWQALDDLRHQRDRVLARIRAAHPNYASLTQFPGITADRVRSELLDEDTVLIEFLLERNRNFVWAVTREGITGARILRRPDVDRAARAAYEALTARNREGVQGETPAQRQERLAQADAAWPRAAAELSELLLGPIAASLAGKKRWLIVSDEILHHVPFAALPAPGSASREAYREVVNLPSAAVLAMIRQLAKNRSVPPNTVAIFADPVFEAGDERLAGPRNGARPGTRGAADDHLQKELRLARLAFTRREADAILALVPPAQRRLALGFAATRDAALDPALTSYRILHFATHGLLNEDEPALSGIALSLFDAKGQPRNGFLRLHDIYNLKLPVDLVVLSACQSALGKRFSGEGLISLTRGMIYAGASRVVASLWKVDDAATAEFMRLFYHAMLREGKAPAAALFTAQRQMAAQRRWSSPYYWAAFQLHGEYR